MAGGSGISPRVAATTIEEWAKRVNSEVTKHNPLIALLKKKGKIRPGVASGGAMRWVPRVSEHSLKGFKDMKAIAFERVNTLTNATLPWRGKYLQDAISLREKLEQQGPAAMIRVFEGREQIMREAGVRAMAEQFFKDGDSAAAAAAEDFHGIESMMAIATGQVDADKFATALNDTYAGLSTVAGAVDPTNTSAWSPVVVNTDRNPGSGTQAWSSFADEYIRRGLLEATRGSSPMDRPDLVVLTKTSYEELLNVLDGKERLNVSRGQGQGVAALGFTAVSLDGVDVLWDDAVPSSDAQSATVRGYAFNTDRLELRLLNKGDLFSSKVTFNDTYQADHIFLYIVGNFKFESPRHFVKFADISAV